MLVKFNCDLNWKLKHGIPSRHPDAIARGAWNLNLEKRDFSSIYVLPALIVLSVKI